MKTLKCNVCHKKVDVQDDYHFKSCPNCRTKYLAALQKKKLIRQFNKDSKKILKEFKIDQKVLPKVLWNFSNFYNFFHKQGIEKTFEDYRKEISEYYRKIKRKNYNLSRKLQRKLNVKNYPLETNDCLNFRLKFLKEGKLPLEFHDHITHCESCNMWQIWYRKDFEDNEGEDDAFNKPFKGLNIWEQQKEEQETNIFKDLDYAKSKNEWKDVPEFDKDKDYESSALKIHDKKLEQRLEQKAIQKEQEKQEEQEIIKEIEEEKSNEEQQEQNEKK
jgi:hypothetical protein